MEKLAAKKVADSKIDYYPYEIFPQDLNPKNTVFGGTVMAEADKIAGIVAQRHSSKVCVTLLVDSIMFLAPAKQGETLIFKASLNRVWNTSMEIGVRVLAENMQIRKTRHVLSAYFTFVALDKKGRPAKIAPVRPENDEEKRRFNEAQKRRKHRLKNLKK